MTKPAAKREMARVAALAFRQAALERWFAVSGETLEGLIAEIRERHKPGMPTMGIDAGMLGRVFEHPALQDHDRIRIGRAMQFLAIEDGARLP